MSSVLAKVLEAVNALQPPDALAGGGRVFSAAHYPSSQFHRIGKDMLGNVAVLLALNPAIQDDPLPPVVLENLGVLHSATCRIRDADGNVESGVYTVVSCTSADKSLIRHFVTLVSSLVLSLPERPSCQIASVAIARMIRLFRSLQRPSTRSIQGLWGELFVIKAAKDAKAMVSAWRADPLEQFDFATLDDRLEVKSTTWSRRSHHFSLAQLRPSAANRVIIASVQIASMTNGLTLRRLWHEVRARVEDDPALLLSVDQIVTTSLGRAWRRGLDVGFDESVARNTLAFFDARLIPSIELPLSVGVSEVRFRSDLSTITASQVTEIRTLSQFFEAAMPVTT